MSTAVRVWKERTAGSRRQGGGSPCKLHGAFPRELCKSVEQSREGASDENPKRTGPVTQTLLMTPAAWVKHLGRQRDYRGLRSEWEGKSDFLAEVCGALCTENLGGGEGAIKI